MRLIDADALLLSIRTTLVRSKYKYAKNPIISDVLDGFDELVMGKVKNAPTVDAVEVVHGRWIHRTEKKWGLWENPYYECSNCGSRNPLYNFNYCFNCGAKMDKNENM